MAREGIVLEFVVSLRPATMFRMFGALATADVIGMSDRELLARFVADSDQAAFAAVAARYTGMVLGVCRRALPRPQDAEDARQVVFFLLAEKAARTRGQMSGSRWRYSSSPRVAPNAPLSAR